MTSISSDYWPCASPCAEEGPKDGAPSPFGVLQEQFKFVYDTLEEYVVCGTSFFYVQELSERLKAKSLKDKKTKKHPNEYEKEYSVSHSCACFSRKIPPELKKKTGEASPKYKGNHSCLGCCPVIVVIAPLGNCKFLPNLCAPTFTLDPTGNHLEKNAAHWQSRGTNGANVRCRVFIWSNISYIHLPFGRLEQFGSFDAFDLKHCFQPSHSRYKGPNWCNRIALGGHQSACLILRKNMQL